MSANRSRERPRPEHRLIWDLARFGHVYARDLLLGVDRSVSRCVIADTRALDSVDVLSAIRAEGGDARRGDFQRIGPPHLGLVLTRRGRRVLARHGQADLVRSQGSAAGREERTIGEHEEQSDARPLVVHLLPDDPPRGAQTYARAIRDRLDGRRSRHILMTLFASDETFASDLALDVPRRRGLLGVFNPRAAVALRRALRRLEPDVLVAHGGEPLKYAGLVAPRTTKLVYLKIGSSQVQLRSKTRRFIYATLARRFDIVAGVSQEMVAEAADLLRVPQDRLAYIPNGRDPARFRPAQHGAHVPVQLCFVGYLTRTKRPERFIEVVRYLRSQGFDASGLIVGGGPLERSLAVTARDAHVEMLGVRDDVPAVLARCDIFLFTSIAEGEGMPGVLIEAGMAGLPTVSTSVAGARDVIEHGVTGFVVPTDDFTALATAAARLVSSPELRAQMGTAARERCLEHFTLDASAMRLEGVLESLIAGSAA